MLKVITGMSSTTWTRGAPHDNMVIGALEMSGSDEIMAPVPATFAGSIIGTWLKCIFLLADAV